MKKTVPLLIVLGTFVFLSACGKSIAIATETPLPSVAPTLDPCSTNNLPVSIKPVNDLTRQFNDDVALASNTPQSQLVQVIQALQTTRRAAEDQVVPTCLGQLQKIQRLYMDTYIQTFLAFESNASSDVLNAGVAQANQYHDQYTLELARLLGITIVAPSVTPTIPTTPAAAGTMPAPGAITVINPGPNPINLHVSASLTSVHSTLEARRLQLQNHPQVTGS